MSGVNYFSALTTIISPDRLWGFAPGRTRWVRPKCAGFFLPKQVLSEVFRGKFTDGLKGLFRGKKLAFHGSLHWLQGPRAFARFLHTLHRHKWVVYPKKPFGGPEGVLHYLARYTHRVAISNHRLINPTFALGGFRGS
jgi:hypothetical protein